jgi:hypothetical protein
MKLHVVVAVGLLLACSAARSEVPIARFSTAAGPQLPAPWQVVTLPKIPRHTGYTLATSDGRKAVRAEASGSYANVIHPLDADVSGMPVLRFGWRVDRFPAGSDLSTKQGDDVAAKVCALFDVPLEYLPTLDRWWIVLGRRLFNLQLPSATLCYVWDRTLQPGTWLSNAYTDRVRMLVLRSAAAGQQGRWFDEQRDLRADFAHAFPHEARELAAVGMRLPVVAAVGFATDADNTGSDALAWFGDIELSRE